MRIVAALGGNALLRRGQRPDADTQRENLALAVDALALIAGRNELVVTHGNGPQVGLLALQAEGSHGARPYPLDVLGAESEGMVGYLLDQELGNRLPDRQIATLLTQVVVDPDDQAFEQPSKPIGPAYSRSDAELLAWDRGYSVARDGEQWRRVVPSPEPRRIVEMDAIRALVATGVLVVCVGGGGVPVTSDEHGALRGVEAVIDKDLAAALLARELRAEVLLLLTDVPGVEVDRGTPKARVLSSATPAELRELDLAGGSMGPKAEAAARFAEGGGMAVIAALGDAAEAVAGRAGTVVKA